MSGVVSGVQQRIREHCPNTQYVHCKSYNLNLVVTESCENYSASSKFDGVRRSDDLVLMCIAKTKGNSQVLYGQQRLA